MAEYSELQNRFHLIAGTYISAKIFSEYGCLLKHEIDTSVKGQRTVLNRVVEAEALATKVVNLLGEQLKSIGCDLGITEIEIENLETIIYDIVTLDEVKQKRIMGLVNKLKRKEELVEA